MDSTEISRSVEFVVGSIAGLISDSTAHPLDTIRARIVMQRKLQTYNYRGVFDAIKSIRKTEGIKAFYKGFVPVLLFTVPAHGFYFYSYEESKRRLYKMFSVKEDSFILNISCGLIADIFGSFLWVPMDVMKQNAMVHVEKTQLGVIREIFVNEGIRGFYRGYFASLWTFAPYVMFNFGFYEKIKKFQAKVFKREPDELPKVCYLLGATCSSFMSSLLTTPFCVGRTRIQCDPEKAGRNIFQEMLSIVREEGMYSLLEVWKARALWFALGTAVTFFSYESLKSYARDRKKKK